MNINLDLKLLGDLQVYDLPYLSLYADKTSHMLYLSFRITSQRGPESDYIVAPVSADRLFDYLNGKRTIRNLFHVSDTLYLWHKKRGVKGGISVSNNRNLENCIDNSKYNPCLCEDEDVILEYIKEI